MPLINSMRRINQKMTQKKNDAENYKENFNFARILITLIITKLAR